VRRWTLVTYRDAADREGLSWQKATGTLIRRENDAWGPNWEKVLRIIDAEIAVVEENDFEMINAKIIRREKEQVSKQTR
jgi:hypothetical protein